MADVKTKISNVTDQQDAVSNYLEALLKEVGFGDPEETGLQALLNETVEEIAEPIVETVVEVAVQEIAEEIVEQAVELDAGAEDGSDAQIFEQPISSVDSDDGIDEFSLAHEVSEAPDVLEPAAPPAWAQARFQCLTFAVAGMKIAAPLEKLYGIIEWPASLTVLPGHADWFLGLHRNRDQNVQVVDLAMILKTDSLDADDLPVAERSKYIMLLDEGRIGLASDTVANMLTLESDEVKWKHLVKSQNLVAGTVVDQMCSILDIDALVDHINQA